MDAAYPLPANASTNSKAPAFGTVSLVFAALTIALPMLIALITGYKLDHTESAKHDGWGGLGIFLAGLLVAFMVCGLSSTAGTITGIVALVRKEAQSWRSVVGLVVNVPVVLFVLYVIVVTQAGNGG